MPQTTSADRRWVIFVKAGTYRNEVRQLTSSQVLRGQDGWDPSRVPSHPSPRKALDVPFK